MALTESQRRMYALEKAKNFRGVATVFTKHSSHILSPQDLVPLDLQLELAEIGQFAEVSHGHLSPEFIWKNMDRLLQPSFPLEGYHALQGSELLCCFHGTVADLQGFIARRSNKV